MLSCYALREAFPFGLITFSDALLVMHGRRCIIIIFRIKCNIVSRAVPTHLVAPLATIACIGFTPVNFEAF